MEKTKSKLSKLSIQTNQDQNARQANSEQHRQGKWLEFCAIATIPLVLVLGNSMIIPVLPDLQRALNINQFQSSLVITLFSVSAALFIPLLGYLSDRFSRKAIIIPALIVYGAAGVLAGFAAIWESYAWLIVARTLQGIGAAGTAPIAMALVGDLYQGGTESQALGLTEASNGAGKVLSPIIGSLFALIVWYAAFFAFPFFCLLSLLAVIFILREPKSDKKPQSLKIYIQKIGDVFREKGKWLISSFFAGAIALFILFGVLFYLSDILEEDPYKIKGVMKGLVLAIPLLGMVTTSYITGSFIKKNGTVIRWIINIGLSLSTASLLFTIFFNENIYVFIGLLTLSSIGTGLVLPCLNTMITGAVSKGERGMITSLYSSLRFFGVAFGPPLFGWLMEISERIIFITVSCLSLATLLLVFFMIRPEGKIS